MIGEIVMLLRRVFPRSVAAHAGRWDKSAQSSYEVRGKTLGIVGYGNIGSQLSNLAEAMGMRVIFHDLTDKLRHGNTSPTEKPRTSCWHQRRGEPARAGDARDLSHDRRRRDRRHEARRLSDQQQPRHGGRSRRARRRAAHRSPRRRGHRRVPGRAVVERGAVRDAAAGARQRDPDAAYRRLDRRGAGAHRRARSRAS